MFYYPIEIIWDTTQECIQTHVFKVNLKSWGLFSIISTYTANIEKVILCENRSINIWWKKEDILLRKNLANVVSKNLKILNGNHKHCCRANIVFFPVGHLISFSELRTPPAVSDTMAKSGQICQIGFLEKQDWISSNAQTGRLQHLEMLLIQLPKHWF